MPHQQDFIITLEQEVIVSQSSATAGEHQTLDYLPGGTLLGLAASRGYTRLEDELAWRVFHAGEVLFGDVLPLTGDDQPAWPVPLAWHAYKGESHAQDRNGRYYFNRDIVFDPSDPAAKLNLKRQPKQLRSGYVSASGEKISPLRTQRMKTAINPDTACAAEGQLFGAQSLRSGQRFAFRLEAAESLPAETFTQLVSWLTGEARLGRSRSAQYGRVHIEPVAPLTLLPPRAQQAAGISELTLWLLSELALEDAYGQPALQPEAELLGLPAGSEWQVERSFLRTRRYSPFNAKRRSRDPERQVISRGSVLRYVLPRPLDSGELVALTRLGHFQEAGLGLTAVNPQMLAGFRPVFAAPISKTTTTVTPTQTPLHIPNTPLIRHLQRQLEGDRQSDEAARQTRVIYCQLCHWLEQARIWNGLAQGRPFDRAPGRSQWGQIKELASQNRHNAQALWRVLFEGDQARLRLREGTGWELPLGPDHKLGDAFKDALRPHARTPYFPELIGRLAARGLSEDWQHRLEGQPTRFSAQETAREGHTQ